ncbi:MAG: efflux RND transporter periplasmic adaptor subunit [Paenibacillaceae bacterium]
MFTKWPMVLLSRRNTRFLVCALLLMSITGCGLLPQEEEKEIVPIIHTPKIAQKPEYPVTKGTIEVTASGSGKLLSQQEEDLFFTEDNQRIKEIYVQSGDAVSQGQLIAELDSADQEAQLRRKEIDVAKAELDMKNTLREASEQSDVILQKQMLDLELLQDELVDLRETVAASKLTAPYDGTIVSFTAKKGDLVKSYDKIGAIADLTTLIVAATFSQTDLNNVVTGMEAVVNINTVGELGGKVSRLPEVSENSSSDSIDNYLLVELESMPEGLSRGTPLTVSVIIQRKDNVLLIPIAALRTQNSRNYVIVSEANGAKGEVDVEIGETSTTEVEIVKGLTEGQKVAGK